GVAVDVKKVRPVLGEKNAVTGSAQQPVVCRPVGTSVAFRVLEELFPAGRFAQAEFWPPLLPFGEPVLPLTAGQIESQLVVRVRAPLVVCAADPAQGHETLDLWRPGHGDRR